jgi:adenosylmethionine-8-amino-7-oxononanoate aminotransferase
LACAAAVAVQKIIKKDNLLENVNQQGSLLESLLKEKISPLPLVGDVRGRGLFWAVEFVRDKEKRLSFSPVNKFCETVVDKALELGLAILGNLGRTGEHYVDLAILSPPYIVQSDEIHRIVDLLAQAIELTSTKYL